MDNEYIKKIERMYSNDEITYEKAHKLLVDYLSNLKMDSRDIINVIRGSIDNVDLAKKKNYLSRIKNTDGTFKYGSKIYGKSDSEIRSIYDVEVRLEKNRVVAPVSNDIKETANRVYSNMTDDEKKEIPKQAEHFDKIQKDIKKEEESKVKKVEVSPERKEKLKLSKSKLNYKKLLLEIGIVAMLGSIASPYGVLLDASLLAVLAFGVRHNPYEFKTKVGIAVSDTLNKFVDFYDPIKREGMSK